MTGYGQNHFYQLCLKFMFCSKGSLGQLDSHYVLGIAFKVHFQVHFPFVLYSNTDLPFLKETKNTCPLCIIYSITIEMLRSGFSVCSLAPPLYEEEGNERAFKFAAQNCRPYTLHFEASKKRKKDHCCENFQKKKRSLTQNKPKSNLVSENRIVFEVFSAF